MNADPFKLLCPYQIAWLRDQSPLALAEKSRRIGWTWTQALGVVLSLAGLPASSPQSYWHSSADMSASGEFIRDCSDWASVVNAVAKTTGEPEVIDEVDGISAFVMRFANGSKAVAGSSNPKFFRSKGGPAGLDEFAFHRDGRELYKAAHATAMFWGYPLRIWSTHNGPGSYFNSLIGDARTGRLKASLHKTTVLDAVEQGIVERIDMRRLKLDDVPAPDSKRRQEWLDELRSTCPDEDTWNEEYMCVPSSDASSLLTYDLISACEVANLQLFDVAGPFDSSGPIYTGFDVGRKRDLSALWALEKVGDVFWTRVLRVFDRVNFTAQEGAVNRLLENRSVKRLCIDATGIGLQMSERLQQRWGKYRVEAVNFSAPVKSELAMPLRRLFEDKLVRIPKDDAIREDLHSVRKIVTAANNIRLDVDRSDTDGHADRFWALGLAYHAAEDNLRPVPPPQRRKPVGW
jgi:phage FluMu gp28-like protein